MNISDSLRDAVATLLRDGSAQYVMPRYQNLSDQDIDTKTSETDFVTIADREMEIFLSEKLPELMPQSWVLGEEAVSVDPSLRQQVAKGLVWCVDPIDGTRNFVQQKGEFCSMISLVDNDMPVASWIYLPIDDVCYFTASGAGCWENAQDYWKQLSPHNTLRQHPNLVGTGTILGLDGEVREAVRRSLQSLPGRRSVGCAGVEAVRLITCAHDFLYHTRITPWDHAPVALFTSEAGMYIRSTPSEATYHVSQTEPLLVAPTSEMWHQIGTHIWSGQDS